MNDQILDDELVLQSQAQERKYAGFWVRTGASFIDMLALSPVMALSFYNLFAFKNLPLQLIIFILSTLYKPFMEYKYGATLGKMAVKIKVVGGGNEKLSLPQSILRYLPWFISQIVSIYTTILLFNNSAFSDSDDFMSISKLQNELVSSNYSTIASLLMLVSCIVVAFNKRKQGLHDKIANTFCVYNK